MGILKIKLYFTKEQIKRYIRSVIHSCKRKCEERRQIQRDTITNRIKTEYSSYLLLWGLNCVLPPKKYVEILSHSTSECDLLWK